jgi:hypothetical protein
MSTGQAFARRKSDGVKKGDMAKKSPAPSFCEGAGHL